MRGNGRYSCHTTYHNTQRHRIIPGGDSRRSRARSSRPFSGLRLRGQAPPAIRWNILGLTSMKRRLAFERHMMRRNTVLTGIGAGLIAGGVFGVMMQMMTAPTPEGARMAMMGMVAKVVRADSMLVGWLYHLFNSAVIG